MARKSASHGRPTRYYFEKDGEQVDALPGNLAPFYAKVNGSNIGMSNLLADGWTFQNECGSELDYEEALKIRALIGGHKKNKDYLCMFKNSFIMKKYLLFIVATLTLLSICSCSKQGTEGSKILGMYKTEGVRLPSEDFANVYNFINNNTVEFFVIYSVGGSGYSTVPGHSDWYYDHKKTYTYFIEDNKIYIPLDETILTIVDSKTLVKDGGPTFYRW